MEMVELKYLMGTKQEFPRFTCFHKMNEAHDRE